MNARMILAKERMWQRPFSGFLLLALALIVPGWAVAYPTIVAAPLTQAVWVLMQVAWRLVPPFVWLTLAGTAVFWLWLLRRLWRQS